MGFDKFRFQIITRTLILVVTIGALAWLITNTSLVFITFFLLVIILLQVYLLITYLEKSIKDVQKLFTAIEHSDFTLKFPEEHNNKSFSELYASLNNVLIKFKKVRQREEEQRHFLENILHHISTSLLIYNEEGQIIMMNAAARKLFSRGVIKNIEKLPEDFKLLKSKLLQLQHMQKELIRIRTEQGDLELSIVASHLFYGGKKVFLVALQNISKEMNERELEAWHKLIRVLTHEIMNSMTPITSLASSANDMLHQENLEQEQLLDLRSAVGAIEKRSAGLAAFITTYRSLVKEIKPQFELVKISDLFKEVVELLNKQLKENNIHIKKGIVPHDLKLTADPVLMEQVLINLMINAVDAVMQQEHPMIELNAFVNDQSKVVIIVKDNGIGILEEVQPNIFIPFFSTKKQGSGIGLSLSKNIINAHGGAISVSSEFEGGTEIKIIL